MKNSNADKLGVMADINIVITFISAVYVVVEQVIIPMTHGEVFNWIGMFIGGGIIISGLTLYFTLKTIADIYYEVDK